MFSLLDLHGLKIYVVRRREESNCLASGHWKHYTVRVGIINDMTVMGTEQYVLPIRNLDKNAIQEN